MSAPHQNHTNYLHHSMHRASTFLPLHARPLSPPSFSHTRITTEALLHSRSSNNFIAGLLQPQARFMRTRRCLESNPCYISRHPLHGLVRSTDVHGQRKTVPLHQAQLSTQDRYKIDQPVRYNTMSCDRILQHAIKSYLAHHSATQDRENMSRATETASDLPSLPKAHVATSHSETLAQKTCKDGMHCPFASIEAVAGIGTPSTHNHPASISSSNTKSKLKRKKIEEQKTHTSHAASLATTTTQYFNSKEEKVRRSRNEYAD